MNETIENISPDEITSDLYNQMLQEGGIGSTEMSQSIDPLMMELAPLIAGFGIFLNLFMLAAFLLKAWGLWNINKKLGEPYPWLAWIPVIQMYSFVKAGGKKGIWILWMILGFIAFVIPGLIIYIIIAHGISKRTGRTGWSTLGIVFFDFIMLPVIGHKLKEKTEAKTEGGEL